MSVWFEGSTEIDCDLHRVIHALDDIGALFEGVVGLMPGMTAVELVEQGDDFVTIATNEGLMKRTNVSTTIEADRVVVEFDEQYEAGSKVTATTHFTEEFTPGQAGVTHRLVMANVGAPGVLGYLYRTFGSSKMGSAFLTATQTHFEQPPQ